MDIFHLPYLWWGEIVGSLGAYAYPIRGYACLITVVWGLNLMAIQAGEVRNGTVRQMLDISLLGLVCTAFVFFLGMSFKVR